MLIGTTLQVGGTLGTFWLTWFIGKWGFIPVLTTCFLVASASIAAIGQPGLALWVLVTVVFVAGSCVVGGQPTVNSMAAVYYPTYLRSTGHRLVAGDRPRRRDPRTVAGGAVRGGELVGAGHSVFRRDSRAGVRARDVLPAVGDEAAERSARRR